MAEGKRPDANLDYFTKKALERWRAGHGVDPVAHSSQEIHDQTGKAADQMLASYRRAARAYDIRSRVGGIVDRVGQNAFGTPERTVVTMSAAVVIGTFVLDLVSGLGRNTARKDPHRRG